MQEWMKDWILEQDETPTEYINRLVGTIDRIYPEPDGSVRKDDESHYIRTGHYNMKFNLYEENERTLRSLPRRGRSVFAGYLRGLIGADYEWGETKPQRKIIYPEFVDIVIKTEIPIDEINEFCDWEYEVSDTIEEFTSKVLKTRNYAGLGKDFEKFRGRRDFRTRYRSRFGEFPRNIEFNQFLIQLSHEKPGFGYIRSSIGVSHEYSVNNYIRYIAGYSPRNSGVFLYKTTNDGGHILKYPDYVEPTFTSQKGKPAVVWGDDEYYALEGHIVPERWIKEPQSITRDEFLNIINIELRRALTEYIGVEELVKLLNLEVVDTGKYGTLMKTKDGTFGSREIYFIQVTCPSTGRKYHIPVNGRELRWGNRLTADAAVAWTFGMTEEEYKPTVET